MSGAGRTSFWSGGLVRHRDFRLLWLGETVSQVGTAMAAVAMPLLAVAVLHAGTFTVTVLAAMAWVPWLLVGLPAGVWVDRLPGRTVMVACDVASGLLYASVPAAGWAGVLTVGQLGAVAFLGGTAGVIFTTAYQAYLPALVAAEDLVEANAKLQGSASAARLGGPGLAGLVAQLLGAAAALLFNAVSFLVSAACLLGIRTRVRTRSASGFPGTLRAGVAEGVRMVARDPYLRPMAVFAAVANLGLSGHAALAVVFLVRVIGLGPLPVGLLLAVPGVSGLLGALIARRLTRRAGTARALVLSALVALPFGLLIPLTTPGPGLALYAAGTLVAATGTATASIIIASFRQAYSPPAMRGRVTATMWVLLAGTQPFGALFGGAVASAIGVRDALWILFGIVTVSGTTLFSSALTRQRELPLTMPGEDHAEAGT